MLKLRTTLQQNKIFKNLFKYRSITSFHHYLLEKTSSFLRLNREIRVNEDFYIFLRDKPNAKEDGIIITH